MTSLDVVTKQLRGPLATTPSGMTTWARIFVWDERFFVAETDSRGARVRSVTEYPVPDGEPNHGTRSWGEWSWRTCGCGNSWGKWPLSDLFAMAKPMEAIVTGGEGVEVPAGSLEDRLAWISSTDDMAERKSRATAIYEHESDTGSNLDGLDALLDAAVYADSVAIEG